MLARMKASLLTVKDPVFRGRTHAMKCGVKTLSDSYEEDQETFQVWGLNQLSPGIQPLCGDVLRCPKDCTKLGTSQRIRA